ncbi:hypothetical protein [Catellatospora citrea]|uniref:Uncharacterized protein n=1 Tax=Catellatospora citrea TaxID=53366 RepID=A0A8J3KHU1_9ACTN|nr:hypothetical protein [Catellatospora citrea]RKE10352.1 hypothetical protein C8E86_5247 [Catellatospora citrea]GIF99143.1 hypothetical protein Cci01nite_42370 [Catellatospora citrea]
MKLWELVSVCRSEPHLVDRLGDRAEWAVHLDRARRAGELTRDQLDQELPDEACAHVLEASSLVLWLGGGYVRLSDPGSGGVSLSAAEVFRRYGGRFLEDVCEYGLVRIP